jgi:hypothetical protein
VVYEYITKTKERRAALRTMGLVVAVFVVTVGLRRSSLHGRATVASESEKEGGEKTHRARQMYLKRKELTKEQFVSC